MAAARQSVTMRVHLRWWLRQYLMAVAYVAWLTGREPDMGKVGQWIRRGIVVRTRPVRGELEA